MAGGAADGVAEGNGLDVALAVGLGVWVEIEVGAAGDGETGAGAGVGAAARQLSTTCAASVRLTSWGIHLRQSFILTAPSLLDA
jgi:hypothetical protein